MADPELKATSARDVALLRLVGMKPIVVHGGGWRIDELLATMGIPARRHRGLRMTHEKELAAVEGALGEQEHAPGEYIDLAELPRLIQRTALLVHRLGE